MIEVARTLHPERPGALDDPAGASASSGATPRSPIAPTAQSPRLVCTHGKREALASLPRPAETTDGARHGGALSVACPRAGVCFGQRPVALPTERTRSRLRQEPPGSTNTALGVHCGHSTTDTSQGLGGRSHPRRRKWVRIGSVVGGETTGSEGYRRDAKGQVRGTYSVVTPGQNTASIGLENRGRRNPSVGSNPTPPAIYQAVCGRGRVERWSRCCRVVAVMWRKCGAIVR